MEGKPLHFPLDVPFHILKENVKPFLLMNHNTIFVETESSSIKENERIVLNKEKPIKNSTSKRTIYDVIILSLAQVFGRLIKTI